MTAETPDHEYKKNKNKNYFLFLMHKYHIPLKELKTQLKAHLAHANKAISVTMKDNPTRETKIYFKIASFVQSLST